MKQMQPTFKDRKLVIATKHGKENVIAPILEQALGVKCFVTESLDTDLLGTFTGEVERTDSPLSTARKKCLMAMEKGGFDLALATEGSFGPHPQLFFSNCNDELLVLVDEKNNLEIIARELSFETNFNGEQISSLNELKKFAQKAQFPSHGLILSESKEARTEIVKEITSWKKLETTFEYFLEKYGEAYVETDMRAMFNPLRMEVIKKATDKLVEKILSTCPACQTPGFSITKAQTGLPCSLCNLPTSAVLKYIFTCKNCEHIKVEMYPHKKKYEDPMYCNQCNP